MFNAKTCLSEYSWMSLYSRSQLTSSLSSTACVQYYSSAARFAARTKHLNVWHEPGRSNVGLVQLGRQQCARMPSLLSPWQEGKPQHQHRRATGPSHPSRCLVGPFQGWMMCDPVREHRFRSRHTVYSVHFVHGWHTGPSHPSTKSKGSTKAS